MDLANELIGRARELKPVLASRAAATEDNRAPLDETMTDLTDAGFLQILTPKRYGGHELHIDTLVSVSRIISSACASTGWVSAFFIGHNWFHSVFPQESQDEVFAENPYQRSSAQISPTAQAVKVNGGYEVTGQQSWSSGATHATYVFFTAIYAASDAEPELLLFCIPRENVELIDNWYIAGMRGTGSCDVKVDNVFVPEHHMLPFKDFLDGSHFGSRLYDSPVFQMPAAAIIFFEGMAVVSGILRGMVENFQEITERRINTYTGTGVAAKPSSQMRLARGRATADAIDDMVDSITARTIQKSASGGLSLQDRADIRMRCGLVNKMCSDAVNDLMHGAGGSSFMDDVALQRFFRDSNVLRTHAAMDFEASSEMYGRVLLGMDPGTPVL
ncbi:MAG: 3-hydroxy-9,10-secoandrosta-1,3,5(10)-triene-9,17-dione monooxygenase [Gammaproteobacteria bacterium]|jgi:3-hydroxy-9,10-secoandrosta-1,3,5(10)-triene-9,17-dione monooxygenase